jgi:predicted  nucleic acid-binding Zn-ribbon protein
MAQAHYTQMKKQIDNLLFENQTAKKDLTEALKEMRGYKTRLQEVEQREEASKVEQLKMREEMESHRKMIEDSQEESKQSQEKATNLRSALNADRKVLQQKIDDLESKLTHKIQEVGTL